MISQAAVLGSPIAHSLSPAIHNFAYRLLGFDGKYGAIEIDQTALLAWLRKELTPQSSWIGFSLTMPLKEVLCSRPFSEFITVDSRSLRIQSANTIFREPSGWSATSTDVTGFSFLLKYRKFESIALLGSGGTARAALASLSELERSKVRSISVFRRSGTKDDLLRSCMDDAKIDFHDWSHIPEVNSYDLVINTVPAEAALSIADHFTGVPILLDALYSPWLPPLSVKQREVSGELITGLDLLCAQALDQLRLMTQVEFDRQSMFHALRDHLFTLVDQV
jgi:shikimate dehydrogenase